MIRIFSLLSGLLLCGMLLGCNKSDVPICDDLGELDPADGQCICGLGYDVTHSCCSGTAGPSTVDCRLANGTIVEKGDLGRDTVDPPAEAPEAMFDGLFVAVWGLRAETLDGQYLEIEPDEEFRIAWQYFNPNNTALLPPDNYSFYVASNSRPTLNVNSSPEQVFDASWGTIESADTEPKEVVLEIGEDGTYVGQIRNIPLLEPNTDFTSFFVQSSL